MMKLEPVALIDIHPEDAAKYDVSNGETVILRTPQGTLELQINYDSSCLKGVVNVYHGAGEKDINLLMGENYLDPVSGFPGFKSYCCRIEKKEA